MKLTKHFALDELTRSDTADTLGISNKPTKAHLSNLRMTALGLEQVRKLMGSYPVTVTSAYRSAAVNEAVGGVPNSDHTLGYAADIFIGGQPIVDVARMIAFSDIAFDQLIYEPNRGIVHISFNPKLRNEVLTQMGGPGSPFKEGVHDV
ncbi:MAG: D-Ala-D-Ala carboxypeptidase family metallohydrolase [Epibacterium sp.]|nr:D-Ala-D-Ala carboxypeptidase family metallohydrolase [Epibacterium sp.]NQX74660.1 peptidase M15 [Epibacterium sp.]